MLKILLLFVFLATFVCLHLKTHQQTVAIIGTNDIHGGAFPTKMFNTFTNQSYNYGGLVYMAQMINTIQKQYHGNVLYLDGGDQFQGGIEASSRVSNGTIMNDFYSVSDLDGSALGNHQFDYGPDFLMEYLNGRKSPNLAANLKSETGQKNFLPKQKASQIYKLKNGLKIGVIGLITIQTLSTTAGFTSHLFPNYTFQYYADVVKEENKKLRQAGANAVLIVSHLGNECNANQTFGIWNKLTPQTSECSFKDQLSSLLKSLPKGTIDGVVQGHRHQFSHHYIEGVPIIGTINGGFYFNVLYLKFENDKVSSSQIQGPIPVCQKRFSNLQTCQYIQPQDLQQAGDLENWQFHGETVKAHHQLDKTYTKKWLPLMEPYYERLALTQIKLTRIFDQESELGNLITNLMNEACPGNDFVIMNSGGFRTTWYPGAIKYFHYYNMFPFSNTLVSFEMNGKQLLDTLAIIQTGDSGFYPTLGLKQRVSLAQDGSKKFISASLFNNSGIELAKNYKVLSIKFLTDGGDDFSQVINKVYTVRKQVILGEFRDALKPQLIKLGTIRKGTLVDPQRRRLIIDLV